MFNKTPERKDDRLCNVKPRKLIDRHDYRARHDVLPPKSNDNKPSEIIVK